MYCPTISRIGEKVILSLFTNKSNDTFTLSQVSLLVTETNKTKYHNNKIGNGQNNLECIKEDGHEPNSRIQQWYQVPRKDEYLPTLDDGAFSLFSTSSCYS